MEHERPKFSANALSGLRDGDHACWLFHASEELRNGTEQFIRDGLAAGERVVLLGTEQMCTAAEEWISDSGVDSEDIELARVEEVFTSRQELNPDELISRLREVREEAVIDGRSGVRLMVDMGWTAGNRASLNEIARLCTRLDLLLAERKLRVISCYDRRVFSATRLLDILPVYQYLVTSGDIKENIYFSATDQRMQRKRHDALLNHVMLQLERDEMQATVAVDPFDAESALVMLKAILDSMGDGVIVTDEQGRMLLSNRAVHQIIGFGQSNLPLSERSRKFGNYLPDKKTPYPVEDLPISRAMRGESVDQVEIYIKNERKEGVWVSVNGRPLRNPGGELRGGIVVIRDVTKQKQAQEQHELLEMRVAQTQKLESLGLLAGGIAHDFNNLLMGILGNAGLALLEAKGNPGLTSRMNDIKITATRLSELTNQLLDYSGQGSFSQEVVNLSELVQEMQEMLRPVISKKARIFTDFGEQAPLTKADPTQVRQIMMNLITNASDALEQDHGDIYLRTGRVWADRRYLSQALLHDMAAEGEYSYFEVQDTGCGISPEILMRIFDPFFTTKVKGRGLGLAAVLGLVRRHRGALMLESSEGQGTTFRVLFPSFDQQIKPSVSSDLQEPHEAATVLVVDDELVVRNIAREMLERSGYHVITAQSGHEGLEIFKTGPDRIDAVLLDMTMPDMDGAQVFRELKAMRPQARVILSSGYSEIGTIEQFPAEGLSGYLQKPYAPEVLVGKIKQILS